MVKGGRASDKGTKRLKFQNRDESAKKSSHKNLQRDSRVISESVWNE
jgi:hypothetical protein